MIDLKLSPEMIRDIKGLAQARIDKFGKDSVEGREAQHIIDMLDEQLDQKE